MISIPKFSLTRGEDARSPQLRRTQEANAALIARIGSDV